MANRTDNVYRNLIWGIIARIAMILLPFISRTIMIYTLGIDYVGLGSLFSSILGVLSLAELGFGSAIVYSMYKPVAEDNKELICQLLGFYKKCYHLIGLIILVIGIFLLPFLDKLVSGEVPEGINLQILFIIYLLNNVISYFLFAYKNSVFLAYQRVDLQSKISLLINVGLNVLQIVILLSVRNYYLYAILIPVSTLINNLLILFFSQRMFPNIYPTKGLPEIEKKVIKTKIAGMIFQKIGGIILTSVDTIVISAFLGLKVLGIYNGYYYIITALVGFLAVIQTALIPSVGNSVAKETKEKNYRDFNKFQFIYLWILAWWSSCLVSIYPSFMELWQGSENTFPFIIVILFAIYFYTHHMGDFCYIYKESLGLWWEGKFVTLISSVVNLTLNIILVNYIGISGILISTIIAITFVNVPYGGWILFKYYFTEKGLYKNYILQQIYRFAVSILVALITYFCCSLWTLDSLLLTLLKNLFICVLVPNMLLVLLYFPTRDFKLSFQFIKSFLSKRGIKK